MKVLWHGNIPQYAKIVSARVPNTIKERIYLRFVEADWGTFAYEMGMNEVGY